MKTTRKNLINALAEIELPKQIQKIDVFTENDDNVIKCYFSSGEIISRYYNSDFIYKYSMSTPVVTDVERGKLYDVLKVLSSEFKGAHALKYNIKEVVRTLNKRIENVKYRHFNIKDVETCVYPESGFNLTVKYKNGEKGRIDFTQHLKIESCTDSDLKENMIDFYNFLKDIRIFVHRYAYQLEI